MAGRYAVNVVIRVRVLALQLIPKFGNVYWQEEGMMKKTLVEACDELHQSVNEIGHIYYRAFRHDVVALAALLKKWIPKF